MDVDALIKAKPCYRERLILLTIGRTFVFGWPVSNPWSSVWFRVVQRAQRRRSKD